MVTILIGQIILQNPFFYSLVSAGVGCCLLIGTLFDYYLEHQKNKQVTTITQRFSVPSLKSANGKTVEQNNN